MKLALLIEYDGTAFAGWQTQGDHPKGRSVQNEIEKGFHRLFLQTVTVHGAGRTDAGVHARGMVAHVELPETIPSVFQEGIANGPRSKLVMALNATTPKDIAILDLRPVPTDFHARHSASARQYRYTIKIDRSAIDRNYVWAIRGAIDASKLEACAQMLVGEFDFTSFSKRTNDVKHYRCIVERAEWYEDGKYLYFIIRANRFVRGMVRALVGAMVAVGQGKLSPEEFRELLHQPREVWRAKYIAPAHGLVLEGVTYPERFELWKVDAGNSTET
ncbi:MAG TPA: tRNA pseudouridine(38-40) synthase TruA [Candidatus Kapabacteria bacterium]